MSSTDSKLHIYDNKDKLWRKAIGSSNGTLACDATIDKSGLATDTLQTSGNLSLSSIDSKITACDTSSLSTSALQTSGNNILSEISAQNLSKDGFSQVLLTAAGGISVKADSTCTIQADPEHRDGWNCINPVAGTKFNLYYFSGVNEIITLGQVQSVYWKGMINVNSEFSSKPFINIYTKPTGIGDQQPWYHSRIDYLYNNDNTIGIGEECVFYGKGSPSTEFNNRKIALNNVVVNGDGLDSEEVLYMVVSSDSATTQNALNTTINLMGFNTSTIKRNLILKANIADDVIVTNNTDPSTGTKQDTQTSLLSSIDTETTSINSKLVRGDDENIASALEVSLYARHPTGPDLGLLHMTNGHNLKVSIEETDGGADLATETTLASLNGKVTNGNELNLSTIQQVGSYAWDGSNFRRLLCNDTLNSLLVSTLKKAPVTTTQTINALANGTALSNTIDMEGYSLLTIQGNTTNTTDSLQILTSIDDVTYRVDSNTYVSIDFSNGDYSVSLDRIATRYIKIRQIDTTTTAFTLIVETSRR